MMFNKVLSAVEESNRLTRIAILVTLTGIVTTVCQIIYNM